MDTISTGQLADLLRVSAHRIEYLTRDRLSYDSNPLLDKDATIIEKD